MYDRSMKIKSDLDIGQAKAHQGPSDEGLTLETSAPPFYLTVV